MAESFKNMITYLVKCLGDWALGGPGWDCEALAANLGKRNPLEEGAGGGGVTTAALSAASASVPCTS